MARPIRRAPPVTRATPRAAEAPEAAGTSVNPTELDQVHQGHDGDEAEDDAERQHGDPPVSPRLRGRRGGVQAGMGEYRTGGKLPTSDSDESLAQQGKAVSSAAL